MNADLDRLIAPIPGAAPTGASLRYETTYQHIAEARREDDATLPQGNWERPLKRADWNLAEQLCTEALATRSKDIQIAAWLAEAWLHLHGLDGMARGIGLVESLCGAYWESIHPQIDGGDIEYRVAPFVWINENLALALRRAVALVEDASKVTEAKLTLADWVEALRMENVALKDAKAAKLAEQPTKPTRAIFTASVQGTSPAFFRGLHARIGRCAAAVASLEKLMLERLQDDSPGLGNIRAALEDMRNAVIELGGKRGAAAPDIRETSASRVPADLQPSAVHTVKGNEMADEGNLGGDDSGSSGTGPITSRAEAFRRLSEAADYLMRTEPHSPCPYLVKRAVAWGKMPLTELLQELVRSEGDLQELYGLLGMNPQAPGESKQPLGSAS